ncbi:MAG TPA: alpha/beta hydrolase domain-containing protein [Longimicrobiales bacterium]|nr:alpha/beta hydrolase domain-containing protein [Longimicrobiales bacterium]
MMRRAASLVAHRAAALALLALLSLATQAGAQIHRIEIQDVESPALDGRSFGSVGPYERLRGVAHGAVDPDDRRHEGIANLALAPRNADGRVEYSTTFEIYRPVDMRRWNRAIYHTVPNRGGAGAGEDVLLERGFALVRVGWQGDIAQTETNIVAHLPVARRPDGSSIVGPAMEEFIFNDAERVSVGRLTYEAASLDPARATLTVRHDQTSARATPPDLRWTFTSARQIRVERPAGYDGGAIYELVYEAKDPTVMGLGFAAMRDVISFLRYEDADTTGNENPLAFDGLPETAISIGISQSGRMLRDLLYQGFNEDVRGRIVFDGMHPDIAGSRKTFTNYTFSQPGRWQKQHEDHYFPGDQFPFTYVTLPDPISGRTDGLLERCSRTDTCPRIIHTDGEAEIWQARSSLIVTDPLGRHVELPQNVRAYVISGTQHGGGAGVHVATPRLGICQNPSNPMNLSAIRTALTVALHEWLVDGVEPPASRFPTVANGGLVRPSALGFPKIPGVTYSGSVNGLRLLDHGSLPPTEGEAYAVLVGRVDADGNMIDGVRHPDLAVPIGTFTGWNLRRDGVGDGGQCAGTGSVIPFASTRAGRLDAGDPRLSLEERYATHEAYVSAVRQAADALVRERLLLRADADQIVRRAEASDIGR